MPSSGLNDKILGGMLVGGLEPFEVKLVDHDPLWAGRAADWTDRLLKSLPDDAVVEHVGSTSVPDLKAKPVLDLLVTVEDPERDDLETALAVLGLHPRVRAQGRRSLRTSGHDVQVHILRHGDPMAADVIALRDRLRSDPQARRLYEHHKIELAARTWTDMHYYSEAKSSVIAQILGRRTD